jgi:RHS repeat-associated protein
VNSGQPFYFQQDHEGSVTHLTDGTGTVVEKYKYDVFGAPTMYSASGATISSSTYGNRFLFTGREYSSTFGIYEYRARAYHPGLGRFMSEDPKGFDGGDYNLFRYCHNDPEDMTDPMGLDWIFHGSDSDVASFRQAINYISEDRQMAGYIAAIRQHDIPVDFNYRFRNDITIVNGLRYDPTHGQLLRNGVQSPALILAHELKHLFDQIMNRKRYLDTLKHSNTQIGMKQREVTNDNERSAIAAEKHTAQIKREPYREPSDYHNPGVPRYVPDVTTHTPQPPPPPKGPPNDRLPWERKPL